MATIRATASGFSSDASQPAPGMGGTSNSNQSTTVVDFSGATFYNTSRDEMNAWAAVDFLPATADANPYHRVATGALAMIKSP